MREGIRIVRFPEEKTMFAAAGSMMLLALESLEVVRLRTLLVAAGGPGVVAEIELMGTEKMRTASSAFMDLASGRLPSSVVEDYRDVVRANIVRLSV